LTVELVSFYFFSYTDCGIIIVYVLHNVAAITKVGQ